MDEHKLLGGRRALLGRRRSSFVWRADTTVGELVAGVFAEAAHYAADRQGASLLAARAANHLLRRATTSISDIEHIGLPGKVGVGRRTIASSEFLRDQVRAAVYAAATSRFQSRIGTTPRIMPARPSS